MMKFIIHGGNITITEAIRDYIELKIGKIGKYFDDADNINVNVTVKVNGIDRIVEVTIPSKKLILRAEESNRDLYAAVDNVLDKLERQLRKNKTKMKRNNTKFKNNGFIMDYDSFDEMDMDNSIVKRKVVETKPMSEEEAILQMELLGHTFFVFKNDVTNCVDVVYKRNDSNYGLIEVK